MGQYLKNTAVAAGNQILTSGVDSAPSRGITVHVCCMQPARGWKLADGRLEPSALGDPSVTSPTEWSLGVELPRVTPAHGHTARTGTCAKLNQIKPNYTSRCRLHQSGTIRLVGGISWIQEISRKAPPKGLRSLHKSLSTNDYERFWKGLERIKSFLSCGPGRCWRTRRKGTMSLKEPARAKRSSLGFGCL